ncbi:MAG: ABC-2 type transport system permease protein [Candidatus Azotimanducaceae bacterium]|jgi:ABC-2 type transport system permease protein
MRVTILSPRPDTGSLWRAYLSVIAARYRTLLQYRAAAFAGVVTQLFWGAIRLMVLLAFFELAPNDQPMTVAEIAAYVWLGQALLAVFPWNVDGEIAEMIRSGSVAYELTRPLNLYWFWFARTIALRTAPTTLRCLPMIIFAMWVMPALGLDKWALAPPPDWAAGIGFLISQTLGLMLACAMTMLMHVVLVWTLSGDGINRIFPSIALVLSGNILPLPLFPDWMQSFLELQPFQGLVDVPFRIYAGNITGSDVLVELAQQVFWTTIFIAWGYWALGRVQRRLVAQGG